MDLPSLPRRGLGLAVLAAIALLVLAGRLLAGPAAPATPRLAGRAAVLAPAEPARLLVHVVGAVRRPGLYRLRAGSRVADAVARAGGAGKRAELASINLAAPVVDGTQVVVPRRPDLATSTGPREASESAEPAAAGPVSLNSATLDELDALPGVGPVTAQKILDFRRQHGAFASADELDAVPGIGPARLEELRALVAP